MTRRHLICVLVVAGLSGCGPNYSPDTYSTTAVQQANKVEQGVIVGVRNVDVSASGATGTVAGAAAGGIAGAQAGSGPISALSALGGSLVGGLAGSAVEHATADTSAFEYIVRKSGGDLVSVTQKDKTALMLGLHVLVIAGNQARIVPDYTVPADPTSKPAATDKPKSPEQEGDKPGAPISLAPPGSAEGDAVPASVTATPLAAPTAGPGLNYTPMPTNAAAPASPATPSSP